MARDMDGLYHEVEQRDACDERGNGIGSRAIRIQDPASITRATPVPIWSRKASISDVEALRPCTPAVPCEPQLYLLDHLSAEVVLDGLQETITL